MVVKLRQSISLLALLAIASCGDETTERLVTDAVLAARVAYRFDYCTETQPAILVSSRGESCDALRAAGYIQCDETTVQVLKEPGKAAQSTSYMWVQRSALPERSIILFDYDPTRSGEVPKRLLEGFSGILQTDGYHGYNAVVRELGLVRLYCMAHYSEFDFMRSTQPWSQYS